MYALEVGKKRSQQNNSNKWRADVDRLTTYDSRYHRYAEMLKTLKKNRRKYLSHFQNTARHQLRRTAVSWTVIEPPAKSSKVKLYERLSIDFWHFYEIGSIMFRNFCTKECGDDCATCPIFFPDRKTDYLRTYMMYIYLFLVELVYMKIETSMYLIHFYISNVVFAKKKC